MISTDTWRTEAQEALRGVCEAIDFADSPRDFVWMLVRQATRPAVKVRVIQQDSAVTDSPLLSFVRGLSHESGVTVRTPTVAISVSSPAAFSAVPAFGSFPSAPLAGLGGLLGQQRSAAIDQQMTGLAQQQLLAQAMRPSAFTRFLSNRHAVAEAFKRNPPAPTASALELYEFESFPRLRLVQIPSSTNCHFIVVGIATGGLVALRPPDDYHADPNRRLHSETGPALAWGEEQYWYWHGAEVPELFVLEPERLDPKDMLNHNNMTVRRAYIERIGVAKLSKHGLSLHHDDTGELWSVGGQRYVRVLNSTENPDGSRDEYFLAVPPFTRTAKEGVAWTFNMRPEEYAPHVET